MTTDASKLDDPAALGSVLEHATLSEEALAVKEGETAREYLGRLAAEEQFPDAIRVLAQSIGKREAVWWACLVARETLSEDEPKAVLDSLQAAEGWVIDPNEEHRRKAEATATVSGLDSPAGCAAMGAFFSGGSLAPPNVPEVPAAGHLTGHVVSGGVMLGGVRTEPEKAPEKYKKYLEVGLQVADGTARWPGGTESVEAPSETEAPQAKQPRPEPQQSVAPNRTRSEDQDERPMTRPTFQPEPRRTVPRPKRTWDDWE